MREGTSIKPPVVRDSSWLRAQGLPVETVVLESRFTSNPGCVHTSPSFTCVGPRNGQELRFELCGASGTSASFSLNADC